MKIKRCSKCKEEKLIEYFSKNKATKDGYCCSCKICDKIYRDSNKERIALTHKNWREDNKEDLVEKKKTYYNNNKETISEKDKQKYQISREHKLEYQKNYQKNNKEEVNKYRKKYYSRKRQSDCLFKLCCNVRSLIRNSFKRGKNQYKKSTKTENILGCSIEEFINHLESLFTEGMSLNNHGNCEECWHIDHKYPISLAKTEEEIIKLCHYSNLQPLWSRENIKKGNNLIY